MPPTSFPRFACALALLVPGASRAQPTAAALDTAAVGRFVERYRERHGVPGVGVAVTRGDSVVYVAGYGTTAGGTPITPRTPLPIASLSKSMTALAVMQLVEAGRVALDRPVRDYLPEFTMADPRAARITVRQLLDHRSGMADTRFREKSVAPAPSLQAAVALLRTATLASDPGARMHYHNPNYWVAARLVEVVSGEPFADYLRRHVFEPAGMHASTTAAALPPEPTLARGHVRLYGVPVAAPEPPWFLDGASGVVTTADDMARWLVVHGAEGRAPGTPGGVALLSPAGIRTLHDSSLGWSAGPAPGTFAHSGWLFTFMAHQIVSSGGGYAVAVMTTRGLTLGNDDAQEIARAIFALAGGATPTVGAPVGWIVDLTLLALTVLVVLAARRRLRRPARWPALSLVLWLVPVAAFAGLRQLIAFVFGGRDGTWLQLAYIAPALVVWLAVSAACGLVVVARGLHRPAVSRAAPPASRR